MKPVFNHPWDLSKEEAIELQNTLANLRRLETPLFHTILI